MYKHHLFRFERVSLQFNPLNQSTKRFNSSINTGSNLSSSKILKFTCNYSEKLQSKLLKSLAMSYLSGPK